MHLIARTDAESGKLISSTIDTLDHPFILGVTNRSSKGLAETIAEAEMRGASGAVVDEIEKKWMSEHKLVTFDQGKVSSFSDCRIAESASQLRRQQLMLRTSRTKRVLFSDTPRPPLASRITMLGQ